MPLNPNTLMSSGMAAGLVNALANEISGNSSSQVSIAGVFNGADTTEDTLFTTSLPPSTLNQTGNVVQITAFGTFGANAHTKTVKIYFGTGTVFTLAAGTIVGAWWAQLEIFRGTGVSTQISMGQSVFNATHQGVSTPISGTDVETGSIICKITGQSTAVGAGTEIGCNAFNVFVAP